MSDKILTSVLRKLYFQSEPELICGLDNTRNLVFNMLRNAVLYKQGDSCLLLGPRASGKTLILNSCLSELEKCFSGHWVLVRLSGLVHSDDKMALREIARQLDVLTHNSEDIADIQNKIKYENIERTSFSATVANILTMFQQAELDSHATAASVVFVLDEIDRFALHSRQTLLYTLLDLSQTSPIGVGVVGLSVRANVPEMLEKRVRSRFSQRTWLVAKPSTLKDFSSLCFNMLRADSSADASENEKVVWNSRMSELICSGHLAELVSIVYYTSKDPRQFAAHIAPQLARTVGRLPLADDFAPIKLNVSSSTNTLLMGISELEWALLISAARAQVRFSTHSVNLVLAYDEYKKMVDQLRTMRAAGTGVSGYRSWSARSVRDAWERLISVDLLVAEGPGTPEIPHDLRMMRLETGLQDIRGFLSHDHPLYNWTRL